MKENLKDLKTNLLAIVIAILTLLCAIDDFPPLERFRLVFIIVGILCFIYLLLFASSEIPKNLDKLTDLFSNGEVLAQMKELEDKANIRSQVSHPSQTSPGFFRKVGTKIKFLFILTLLCGSADAQSHINPKHEWYSTYSAAIQYDFNTATDGSGRVGNQPGMISVAYFIPGFVSRSSKVNLIHVDQTTSRRLGPNELHLAKYSMLWPAINTRSTSYRPVLLGISRTGYVDPSESNIMFRHSDLNLGPDVLDPMPLSNSSLTGTQIMTVQGQLNLSLTLPTDFGAIVDRLKFFYADNDPKLPLEVGYVQVIRSEPLVRTGDQSSVSPVYNAAFRMREGYGKLDLNSFSNTWRFPDTVSSNRNNHFEGKDQYNSLLVTSNMGIKTPLKIDRNDISNVATEIVVLAENWIPINNVHGKFYQFDLVAYKTVEGVPISLGSRTLIGNFNTLTQNSAYLNTKLSFSIDSYSQDVLILTSGIFDRETFKPSSYGGILQVSNMAYPWGLSVTHTGVVSSLEPRFSLSPRGTLTKFTSDQFTRNFIWTLAD